MNYQPGFQIELQSERMDFVYGAGVFGPEMEKRRLEDIRKTLMDPNCEGPEVVYTIAMDVGNEQDREDLKKRNLLYGACIYAAGRLGNEPVRSQGHIHAVSPSCHSSTPELYEIWNGEAYIFMQKGADSATNTAYAVKCRAGDKVIVPPGYAHYAANASPDCCMAFGAWCVRDYGFDYQEVRSMGGLSYYPVLDEDGDVQFVKNKAYGQVDLIIKKPQDYAAFGMDKNAPIYTQYESDHGRFEFVTNPMKYPELWENFVP